MTERLTYDQHNDNTITALYDQLDQARVEREIAESVAAETKRLLERRTTTLRERAERAEAERDAAHDETDEALTHTDVTCTAVAERDRAEATIDRVRGRCQGVRDRVGPGGMINATQILGLLSPTWPDGNYEAPSASPAASQS